MLGDNPEKSKNPLKKAMRRRNAKTVQFAAPQYFEPSNFEYSDDEGHDGQVELGQDGSQAESQEAEEENHTEAAAVAPLSINTLQDGPVVNGIQRIRSNDSLGSDKRISPEKTRSPEAIAANDGRDELNLRSRKGVVRNTDSFFKDDSVETKKISLTPRLLRGDSETIVSSEQSDLRPRTSSETFDKIVASDTDRPKDDKKKKEKKGMLSGLFKRKDRKSKSAESEADDNEKVSEDSAGMSPQSKESLDSLHGMVDRSPPQRNPSKLQKQPPVSMVSKVSPTQDDFQPQNETLSPTVVEPTKASLPFSQGNALLTTAPGIGGSEYTQQGYNSVEPKEQDIFQGRTTSPTEKRSIFSPMTTALRSTPSNGSSEADPAVRAVYAKRAKNRFAIDAPDSDDDTTPTGEQRQHRSMSPLNPGPATEQHHRELSESPVHVSPMEVHSQNYHSLATQQLGPGMDTTSMSEAPSMSPPSPAQSSSPSLVDVDTARDMDLPTNNSTRYPRADANTPSTSRSTPTWSDASLRTYMDNDEDIRDLLIIVHDKSNVTPAGPDHPIMGSLFASEKGRLADMQTNLDSLLTGWLSRKNSSLLSR